MILLILSVLTVAALLYHIGPRRIYTAASELGSAGMVIIFLPSVVMYLLDCLGWRMTLRTNLTTIPFFQLFVIRTVGEALNATIPAGYVGGEPLKAYLLAKYGVPMSEGFASVILAKTTMTIAQVAYILIGIGFGYWLLLPSWNMRGDLLSNAVIIVSLSLVVFAAALIFIQRCGFFTIVFAFLQKLHLRIALLEAQRRKLLAFDQTIRTFYLHHRRAFVLSTVIFLCGWLVEGIEVYLILRYLGTPLDLMTAISIDALSTLIKGVTFIVPGSLGVQEAGNLILLQAYGQSDVIGMTFALLRRFRELIWIAIGILCLMLLKSGASSSRSMEQ